MGQPRGEKRDGHGEKGTGTEAGREGKGGRQREKAER